MCPHPAHCPPRIVCAIEAAEAPSTGGVMVEVNGKFGYSPPHVQFTYQVSTWPRDLHESCGLGPM